MTDLVTINGNYLRFPNGSLGTFPSLEVTLSNQYDDLINDGGYSTSDAQLRLARRYATNILSSNAAFTSDFFEIPTGVSFTAGTTFRDDFFGVKHTIVRTGSVTIKNCERWIVNNLGIFFVSAGSGTSSRNLFFYQRGQEYNVLGGGSNQLSITVNASSSTEADQRADNAWFLTDSVIAWVDGTNTIATRDIISGTTGSHTITGVTIDLSQSDGNDARRAYDNPVMNPQKTAYNTANPLTAIDDDKVYRLFHVSADKKQYVILVYTVSTGAWSYLDGGATTSESSSPVIHTIKESGGGTMSADVDYLFLMPSGKRVGSNTDGDGMNIHYPNGDFVLQLYINSSHKSMGPIWDGKDLISEKITGSNADNTLFGVDSGDMLFFQFDPTAETRDVLECLVLPGTDTALYSGGDQGSHNGCRLAAYAGHRDNEVDNSNPGRGIFKKQVVLMDPGLSELGGSDGSKYARFRIAQLNVTTGGGDDADPGAIPDVMYEDPNNPGQYLTGVYWHDRDVTHDGGTGNAIFYSEIPVLPDGDDLATLKAALTASDLVSSQ